MPGRKVEAWREQLKNSESWVCSGQSHHRRDERWTWPKEAGRMPKRRAGGDRAFKGSFSTRPGQNCSSPRDINADVR